MGNPEAMTLEGVRLYTAWHLNLDYSSVEAVDHAKVIAKCYWPILDIAERSGTPLGIELSGSSLELIERIDPSWIRQARGLASRGLVEFLGSGYNQIIGPLTPQHISSLNLELGQEKFLDILGKKPTIAYVNEQCTSEGVLETLSGAGFKAAIIEWENAWIANPNWLERTGYRPQRASAGGNLGIIWNHSRFFQGLQRFAHRELTLDSYLKIFRRLPLVDNPVACFYGGDAETFDFRTGRFHSESKLWDSEWDLVSEAIAGIAELGGRFILPSELLADIPDDNLNLFSVGNQIVTKKQPKYNATRWAVGGRENYELNNYSFSVTAIENPGGLSPWRLSDEQVLRLWSSDFRTHISESRWRVLITEHPDVLGFSARNQPDISAPKEATRIADEFQMLEIASGPMRTILDPSRGLTINSLTTKCECQVNLIGRLPFGAIDGPGHSPDWYTGNVVFQEPGKPQDTELSSGVSSKYWQTQFQQVFSEHDNRSFSLSKRFQRDLAEESLSLEYLFNWKERPRGITRAGLITFLPDGWDWKSLVFLASNGGSVRSSYPFRTEAISHGASVSPLVSAAGCVGLTDGGFSLSDGRHEVNVILKDYSRGAVALLDYHPGPGLKFLRVSFSLQEIDDTSRHRLSQETAFGLTIKARCLSDQLPK